MAAAAAAAAAEAPPGASTAVECLDSPVLPLRLVVRNAAQVVCVRRDADLGGASSSSSSSSSSSDSSDASASPNQQKRAALCGAAQSAPPSVVVGGAVAIDGAGKIAFVGPTAALDAFLEKHSSSSSSSSDSDSDSTSTECVDLGGRGCILPGLVDAHTHPVWAGERVHEFARKLAGATYLEIHAAGGGIGFTVRATRAAEQGELESLLAPRLDAFLRHGATTVEAKSGYGLDAATEVKMLKALHAVAQRHPVEVSPTFCGAHAVPEGSDMATATKDVVDVQLPAVLAARDKGELAVEAIDVFLEKGVFHFDETRTILQAGKEAGLALNFHGDELSHTRAGELAGELGARAVSHLEELDDAGIKGLTKLPSVAVLLPATAHVLRLKSPPARALIEAGVPIALGSDFCPNAHCTSLPMAMHMACVNFRMTMEEALVGATVNAAASIGRVETHGALAPGMVGDLCILSENRWEHLMYQINEPPIQLVVKGGKVCVDNREKYGL